MGKKKHLERVEQLLKKSLVVDFKSISRIIGTKSKKSNYAKLLVSNLLKQGKIKKLCKGYYTKHNENTLAVFCFQPAYLGLQSALSYWGLWEQEAIPVILTPKKVRRGVRTSLGGNILMRNIAQKYYFGFEYVPEGNFYVPYSDLEKTLIDLVVFNQPIDKVVLKEFKKRVDKNKLKQYLKKYSLRLRERVLKKLD